MCKEEIRDNAQPPCALNSHIPLDETSTVASSSADIKITVPRLTAIDWSIVLLDNVPFPSITITILALSRVGKVNDFTLSGT